MTVIFLDVDGVLNSGDRWHELPSVGPHKGNKIDPEAVARLKRLVDAVDALIVVSSSWRFFHMDALTAALANNGIDSARVIGRTGDRGDRGRRGDEIADWVSAHPDVKRFVIFDDDDDMTDEVLPYFVKTTWACGLQDEHVERALELLRRGIKTLV